ncbi:glycoside hydrolase family 43 [Granulicella mallensis MP5ACTX8]|uniref:Glycoside hydrolase family 43 n=1 Tax=Granulicella mallensis (strain ATCC BAA-1857 / DSM 23137 / MP5ACTX8) TaxID=682795 RepID=G8NYI7_GRAMM|nr:glycoside hydrolase family 43 [Granulicella mallensis MP5ACTX8]
MKSVTPFIRRVAAAAFLATSAAALAQAPQPTVIHSAGNPILSDGSYYSADPAPIVVRDTLYILAGRDEAAPNVNNFVMNEWQLFAAKNVASKTWRHYPAILRPETVFAWSKPGHAYAGQIIQGPDKRFYLYAPVQEGKREHTDPFVIGVAVSDSVLGPWKDAHPSGPIVSQSVPEPNKIQNIDPTVWVDADGRVYLYWGTFGRLRGMELEKDMVTPKGKEITVDTLTGFFEAAWLFRRKDTYYMVYADNKAGPDSPCTPANYHACIAYGTAPTPLGPWTYQGVILDPVSSTTSHPGVIEFKKKWYLIYHTADAKGGGHFRRSVAIDTVKWDDSVSPARMLKVQQTHEPQPPAEPSRNLASAALASASNEPIPVQYWIKALNDGIVRPNPLPPDMWGSWTPHNPSSQWIQYEWSKPVTLDGSRIQFWSDHRAGAHEGVAPPAAWHLEYRGGDGWHPVANASGYPTTVGEFVDVKFDPITTRCLRAVFDASGDGQQYAAVAVQEWETLGPKVVSLTSLPKPPSASDPNSGCSAAPATHP